MAEGDALANEIGAFVQAVRARETPPVTGWDGLRALEVAHVVRECVETARAAQFVDTNDVGHPRCAADHGGGGAAGCS